jgi:ferritin-like metal-binding protein YciE
MKVETLHECFALKAMALYDVETQILKVLPKVIKNVTNPKLREALTDHLAETEEQVTRLENIFEIIDAKPKKVKVEAIRGMVEDTNWVLDQDTIPSTLDTLIIGAARHVEHYEISGYMSLLDMARMLGLSEAEELIDETLEEEKNADSALSSLTEEVAAEANDGSVDKEITTETTEESDMDEAEADDAE